MKTMTTLLFIMSIFSASQALAAGQTRGITIKTAKGEEIKMYRNSHALLIGVADYTAGWPDLSSIHSELDTVEEALKLQQFTVTRVADPNSNKLRDAFRNFIADYGYDPQNRLLFYFAGHGFTRDNGNKGYLVPADAPNPEKDERGFLRKAYPMTDLIALARNIESTHALFLFDSCFSGTIFKTRALPKAPPVIESYISKPVRQFITAGDAGEEVPAKSVFTPSFVDAIRYGKADYNDDGYVTGSELGMFLQDEVRNYAHTTPQYGKINDYELSRGDYVFALATQPEVPGVTTDVPATANTMRSILDKIGQQSSPGQVPVPAGPNWSQKMATMQKAYDEVLAFEANAANTRSQKKQAWELFVTRYVEDIPGTEADNKLRETAGRRLGPSSFFDKLSDGSNGPEMVKIPPGTFNMGNINGLGEDDELPVHPVSISKPFALSRQEITFAEYTRFTKATGRRPPNDKRWGRDKRPVINVSWKNAKAYTEWLSQETGERYRLPTEAEWEYAARAGTESFFHFGDVASTEFANFDPNRTFNGSSGGIFHGKTQPVGTYPANDFDLHDMHGNVSEWVEDCYHDSYDGAPADGHAWDDNENCNERVVRGGSWIINPKDMRSANRSRNRASGYYSFVGFRVAKELE